MKPIRQALCLVSIALTACTDPGSVNPGDGGGAADARPGTAADGPIATADAPPAGTPDARPGTPDARVGMADGPPPIPGTPDAPTGNGPPTINTCATYTMQAGTAVTVNFGGGLGNAYSPKCIQIKKGTTVTFSGAFNNHPLAAGVAPNQPKSPAETTPGNPITDTDTGNSKAFVFGTVGTFGYWCRNHFDNSGMMGAVNVVN